MPIDEAKWSPQLAYYHGQKRKRDAVVKAKDQTKYGSIKRFFQPSSAASAPAASISAAAPPQLALPQLALPQPAPPQLAPPQPAVSPKLN